MANNNGSDPLWYKDAIIYELHVKAFCDKSGDGVGDFRGLIDKLDYIKDLGVTAIWLLPFYPSPQKDDGYDIADYRACIRTTAPCATSASSCARPTTAASR
jgi:trehalose synthase (EC:5.4.99.16)